MGPVCKRGVLSNNNSCYLVQPGVVAAIMKVTKCVTECPREGNFCIPGMVLASFVGRGLGQ